MVESSALWLSYLTRCPNRPQYIPRIVIQDWCIGSQHHKLARHRFRVEVSVPVNFVCLVEKWVAVPNGFIVHFTALQNRWFLRTESRRFQNNLAPVDSEKCIAFIGITRPIMVVIKPRHVMGSIPWRRTAASSRIVALSGHW